MSAQLPLEMVETIIDHCHDNTKLLGITSLVCKTWLPPSRFHLFSESRSSRVSRDNCSNFIQLLQAPHSTLPAFFHNLWFKEDIHQSDIDSISQTFQVTKGCEIRSLAFSGWLGVDLSSVSAGFNGITDLSFKLRTAFLEELRFICSFPQLQTLSLSGSVAKPAKDASVDHSIVLPTHLHTLRLRVTKGLEQVLSYIHKHTALSQLYVYNVDPKDLSLFQEYLQRSCPMLRHLTFEFGGYTYPSLDLGCLPQLHSITVTTPYNGPLQWTGSVLQTVFSAQLQAITIVIHTYSKDPLVNEPWGGFDQLLVSERFPSLRVLTVMTGTRHGREVEKGLPGCRARGVLLVKTWGSSG